MGSPTDEDSVDTGLTGVLTQESKLDQIIHRSSPRHVFNTRFYQFIYFRDVVDVLRWTSVSLYDSEKTALIRAIDSGGYSRILLVRVL